MGKSSGVQTKFYTDSAGNKMVRISSAGGFAQDYPRSVWDAEVASVKSQAGGVTAAGKTKDASGDTRLIAMNILSNTGKNKAYHASEDKYIQSQPSQALSNFLKYGALPAAIAAGGMILAPTLGAGGAAGAGIGTGTGTGFGTAGGMSIAGAAGPMSTTAALSGGTLGTAGAAGGSAGLAGSIGKVLSSVQSSPIYQVASTANKVLSAVNTASDLFGSKSQSQQLKEQKISNPNVTPAEAPAFRPVRPGEVSRPASLNEFSGFTNEQTRSALATRGVNQGLGQEEQNYYKNLLQRSLIGEGGEVNTDNPDFLMPIESSYFSKQGQNTSSIMDFIRGLQG